MSECLYRLERVGFPVTPAGTANMHARAVCVNCGRIVDCGNIFYNFEDKCPSVKAAQYNPAKLFKCGDCGNITAKEI